MSDEILRGLLKQKYLVQLDGLDAIEFACIQPVINTIRDYDKQCTQQQLDLLSEFEQLVRNEYMDGPKTQVEENNETCDVLIEEISSLRQRIQEQSK